MAARDHAGTAELVARALTSTSPGRGAARERLGALQRRDPTLAAIQNGLVRYLAQPFAGWEHVTGRPGESTPLEQTLREVEELLGA
jgi:hypothetical protein